MHLVFQHEDGSTSAIPVNSLSTVHVQTWTPAVFGDGGTQPMLVEDQTIALQGVVSVTLGDDAGGAQILARASQPEQISEAEAVRLEAQFETAPAITAAGATEWAVQPWEADA